MKTRMHVLVFIAFTLNAYCAVNRGPSDQLVAALSKVESGGNVYAVGDLGKKEHAYGILQIRKPVCDDVNRHFGTCYRAEQCLGNKDLSIRILRCYLSVYATEKSLGRIPTEEDYARIWNGGPNGWKRECTRGYWKKVLAKKSC